MAWEVIKRKIGGSDSGKPFVTVSDTSRLYISRAATRQMKVGEVSRCTVLIDTESKKVAVMFHDDGEYSCSNQGGLQIGCGSQRLIELGVPPGRYPLEKFEDGRWGFSW